MDYTVTGKLREITSNKYEAIVIASRVARKINLARLVQAEASGADAPIKYPMKVTTEAIKELVSGKVVYKYREETSSMDELFPQ